VSDNYRGRNRIDWDAAFTYWASMPRAVRSFGKVAKKFEVSDTAVRKAAERDRWLARVSEIDRKASVAVERRVIREHEVRIAETLEIIDGLRQQLRERAKAGDVVIDITDFVQLMKLEQLLEGDPTERIEMTEVRAVVLAVYRTAGAFVPKERRAEFLQRLDEATTGLFEPAEVLELPPADHDGEPTA
jgi:hypothetical protein